jgi:hypothetical protein
LEIRGALILELTNFSRVNLASARPLQYAWINLELGCPFGETYPCAFGCPGGIRPAVTWPENNFFLSQYGRIVPFNLPFRMCGSPYRARIKYHTHQVEVGRNVVFAHRISCRGIPSDVAVMLQTVLCGRVHSNTVTEYFLA